MTNEQYYGLIKPYEDARRILYTRIEILNHSLYGDKRSLGPVHNTQSRIKEKRSIEEKLRGMGLTDSASHAKDCLLDIAGIRAICYFVEDIYNLAGSLRRQTDLVVIKEKDYIKSPKENGYRSLHLIVEVPIFLHDEKKMMKVEVQFRTMAMDWWASLEHKIRYKKDVEVSPEMERELYACAEIAANLDRRMEAINRKLHAEDQKERDQDQ